MSGLDDGARQVAVAWPPVSGKNQCAGLDKSGVGVTSTGVPVPVSVDAFLRFQAVSGPSDVPRNSRENAFGEIDCGSLPATLLRDPPADALSGEEGWP
jgi:hypothetical protein